jgi:UDP-N-acetylglucosamine:LPS N-acetylglucosamine transferase
MTEMSRKYWALAVITIVVIGGSYGAVLFTEWVTARARAQHEQWHLKQRPSPATNNVPRPARQ